MTSASYPPVLFPLKLEGEKYLDRWQGPEPGRDQAEKRFMIAAVRTALLSTLMAAMLLTVGPATTPRDAAAAGVSCIDGEEMATVNMINDYRAQNGLPPVWITQTLSDAAEHHSASMAANGYFSHDLTAEGITWSQNMTNYGYSYSTWRGENLAGGQSSAGEVVGAWQVSPTHNSVMLGAEFTAVGIGLVYVDAATYGWYWTTDFGGYVDDPAQLCGGGTVPAPDGDVNASAGTADGETEQDATVAAASSTAPGFDASAQLEIAASGQSANAGDATAATDGDVDTEWTSIANRPSTAQAWFDLGKERSIGTIAWLRGEGDGSDALTVQVSSDGTTWTTIDRSSEPSDGTEWQAATAGTTGRFVRFFFSNPYQAKTIGHLSEVQIFP